MVTSELAEEPSGSYKRPPTLEERVGRLEWSVFEIKWLVRAGVATGIWKAFGLGAMFERVVSLIGG